MHRGEKLVGSESIERLSLFRDQGDDWKYLIFVIRETACRRGGVYDYPHTVPLPCYCRAPRDLETLEEEEEEEEGRVKNSSADSRIKFADIIRAASSVKYLFRERSLFRRKHRPG